MLCVLFCYNIMFVVYVSMFIVHCQVCLRRPVHGILKRRVKVKSLTNTA